MFAGFLVVLVCKSRLKVTFRVLDLSSSFGNRDEMSVIPVDEKDVNVFLDDEFDPENGL